MQEDNKEEGNPQDESFSVKDLDNAPDGVEREKKKGEDSAKGSTPEDRILKLLARIEKISEEKTQLQEDNHVLKEQIHTSQVLDDLIKPYAFNAFWFMVIYSGIVAGFIYRDAMHEDKFHVDPEVLKIMIGSTAANVIGLVGMVLTGVFVGARKRK